MENNELSQIEKKNLKHQVSKIAAEYPWGVNSTHCVHIPGLDTIAYSFRVYAADLQGLMMSLTNAGIDAHVEPLAIS